VRTLQNEDGSGKSLESPESLKLSVARPLGSLEASEQGYSSRPPPNLVLLSCPIKSEDAPEGQQPWIDDDHHRAPADRYVESNKRSAVRRACRSIAHPA